MMARSLSRRCDRAGQSVFVGLESPRATSPVAVDVFTKVDLRRTD
jgi:hypothetical protein